MDFIKRNWWQTLLISVVIVALLVMSIGYVLKQQNFEFVGWGSDWDLTGSTAYVCLSDAPAAQIQAARQAKRTLRDLVQICSGDIDDEVQAAVNALPASGGDVRYSAGTGTFAAQVTRAIDSIKHIGSGEGTYLDYDASTALFDCGSQNDWLFIDMSFDAGGVDLGSGSDCFGVRIWINGTYYRYYPAQDRVFILTAGGGWAATTTGCGDPTLNEFTTNDVDMYLAAFDGVTADEYMQWTAILPPDFATGGTSTVTVQVYWTTLSGDGGASETVQWDFYARAYGNDDALDATWGSGVALTADTWIADEDLHITAESSAYTIEGSPAAGDLIQFRLARDISGDDLEDDVQFVMAKVTFDGV